MKKILFSALLVIILVSVTGCSSHKKNVRYDTPLPPGEFALRKITNPEEIPDFTMACSDLANLRESAQRSISYLEKPSSAKYFPSGEITHDKALASLQEFVAMLESGLSGSDLNAAIRDKFDVYISVGCDDNGTVLYTGYYTPIFNGSRQQSEQFKYPLYNQPADLVKGVDGQILGQKLPDGSMAQYPSRAVIEQTNMLAGTELVWLGDPFEVYIAHVQGSAKIRFEDGSLATVGYTANNGHEYKSISQELVNDGMIDSSQLNLMSMIEYFKNNPQQVDEYVQRNPRYVFFKFQDGSPRGSLNEQVTPFRTIATDKTIFPRGCLAFLLVELSNAAGTSSSDGMFALDQDTGGALRAAGRCDVYMGEGDDAGYLAGNTYAEGRLYYLFLK